MMRTEEDEHPSNPCNPTNCLFETKNIVSDDDDSLDGNLLLDDMEDVE